MRRLLAVWGFGWLLILPAVALQSEQHRFDVVKLKNGTQLSGLIQKETASALTMQQVYPLPGGQFTVYPVDVEMELVDRIEKLPVETRRKRQQEVAAAQKQDAAEAARRAALQPQRVPLPGTTAPAWEFSTKYLIVHSDFQEPVAREIACRLEDFMNQLTTAFPPRAPAAPLRVLLFAKLAEYQAWLRGVRHSAVGTATYCPGQRTIAAWSDVDRLLGEGRKVSEYHQQRLQEVDEHLAKLRRHFGDKPPGGALAQVWAIRVQVRDFEAENEGHRLTQLDRLCSQLYHEVATAYWDQFVYPRPGAGMPRWLEEGLAQCLESAAGPGGSLTWGRLDPTRLAAAQEALAQHELWPLERLLSAPATAFNVNDHAAARARDRTQLTAWAFCYYLAFERKLLGNGEINALIRGETRDDSRQVVEKLTKQPLPELEKAFQTWLTAAKAD